VNIVQRTLPETLPRSVRKAHIHKYTEVKSKKFKHVDFKMCRTCGKQKMLPDHPPNGYYAPMDIPPPSAFYGSAKSSKKYGAQYSSTHAHNSMSTAVCIGTYQSRISNITSITSL
jgi:hypothetical protein